MKKIRYIYIYTGIFLMITSCSSGPPVPLSKKVIPASQLDAAEVAPYNEEALKNNFQWFIEPQFNSAGDYTGGQARASRRETTIYLNCEGRVVLEENSTDSLEYSEGLAVVRIGTAMGYMDHKKNIVIRPFYTNACKFSEGLAAVATDKGWGYIDKKGKFVIEPRYANVLDFSEGLAAVKVGKVWGYIDKKGNMVITPCHTWALPFHEERAWVCKGGALDTANRRIRGGKWGCIDPTGAMVIPQIFLDAGGFRDGVAPFMVKAPATMRLVSVIRQRQIPGLWGYIDRNGEVVIRPTFVWAGCFSQGLAPVAVEDDWTYYKIGYIDREGKMVIVPRFTNASPFSEGIAAVEVNGSWGYIKHPFMFQDEMRKLEKYSELIATVTKVRGNEVVISGRHLGQMLRMGEKLLVETGGAEQVFIETTFPMMTTARCSVACGNSKEIAPGMKVYRRRQMTQ